VAQWSASNPFLADLAARACPGQCPTLAQAAPRQPARPSVPLVYSAGRLRHGLGRAGSFVAAGVREGSQRLACRTVAVVSYDHFRDFVP
jgi:hypothetical protein